MRYRPDSTWMRVGDGGRTVLAGSPLRLFRLTTAGVALVERIEAGDDVSSPLVDRLLDAGAIHPRPVLCVDEPGGRDESHAERGSAGDEAVLCDIEPGGGDGSHAERGMFGPGDVTVVTPRFGDSAVAGRRVTVDDGSVPPLADATVRLPDNRGPSAARNAGRRIVTTPLVAFVDADVDLPIDGLDPDDPAEHAAIERWWRPLLAHFADPQVGLVAPRVTGDDGSSLDLGAEPARIRAGTRVSYVPAAAMIVRATAFDDVGGFDETMRLGEDVDLVWRLDAAGWRCRYDPASTADHRPRPTYPGRLRQQIGYGSSSAPLALRHPHALTPFRSNGWTAAAWSLLAAGHPVAAVALASGSAAALVPRLPDVPPTVSLRIAVGGHLHAGRQLAEAVRRAWWPIVVVASLVSRRARRVALAALIVDPVRAPLDIAFGWGLWREVIRLREWHPLIPRLTTWP